MRTDLYNILKVSTDASQQEIKAAMIELGKKYAVRSQVDHSAHVRFNQIKEAYKVISNPYRRANYDNFLQQKEEIRNNYVIFSITDVRAYFKQKFIQIWQFITLLSIIIWQFIKKHSIKIWQITKSTSIIKWHLSKRKSVQIWKISKLWFFITVQATKKIQAGEQLTTKGWRTLKIKDASMYIRRTLISGEKIIYQAYPHWLFYLDVIGLIFFLSSSYLLLNEPVFIQQNIPKIILWIPWLTTDYLEISVWSLGLGVLVFIGIMVIWEAFVDNKTTELIITSRRILHKTGLLNRTVIDLKLGRFESIKVKQTLAGRIFNYGSITITGMSKMQTTVHHIVAPLKFKKQLWQVLEQERTEHLQILRNKDM
ncbi:DnaJ domain-containing protein [Candidatus Halobeggiatoa sp. HSG11]|nr:DnaJ domain-containing protein [Candidatus Halobeggiatoa sp. HSG11]